MKLAMLLAGAALVSAPAIAQAATEFYVVHDATAKKCMVVDKKPTVTTTMTIAGDGTVYKTRTEAETAMKAMKICTAT